MSKEIYFKQDVEYLTINNTKQTFTLIGIKMTVNDEFKLKSKGYTPLEPFTIIIVDKRKMVTRSYISWKNKKIYIDITTLKEVNDV